MKTPQNTIATDGGLDSTYVYVMVRKDISIEQQIVQTNHACVEAAPLYSAATPHTRLVLLEVKDEEDLLQTAARLTAHGINHRVFFEPDDDLGYSALATEPLQGELRQPLRRYSLYRTG